MMGDLRRYAPAVARNREVIARVFEPYFAAQSSVLEIASGSGEHVVHWAELHPSVTFMPSDPDQDARASIDAWVAETQCNNVEPARAIDVMTDDSLPPADMMVCINMIHIAPWSATVGLMQLAGQMLKPKGVLALYGPFKRNGVHTADSNAAFDDSLRARDETWGIRDLGEVSAEAAANGLGMSDVHDMPANNLTVVWRKRA